MERTDHTRFAAIAVDLSPLRQSRDFRILFAAQAVSLTGSEITYVAIPFQAYALTHSSLIVGLASFMELIPVLLVALVGGALADALDRKRMVRMSEVGLCVASALLLVNALLPHPQISVLVVGVMLAAGFDALQRPSLDALVPRIVSRDKLTAAAALEGLRGNLGMVIAPPIAGVLIAFAGLPFTYGIDVGTFAVSLLLLSLLKPVPPPPDARLSLSSALSGLRYALRRQHLLGSYLIDINAMFFGMPMALFPQIAQSLDGPVVLGALYTAPSAGSLLATVSSGWSGRVRHHGRAIAIAAAVWGMAIIAFGFASSLWIALIALAIAGAADMISGVFRSTLWNQSIPDAMRGRMAGVEMISYTSGPALGDLEAGVVAALAGLRVSIVSGGALCVAGTIALCALLPRFWNYRAD
jgi:MFS family permease